MRFYRLKPYGYQKYMTGVLKAARFFMLHLSITHILSD
ncbi:hypothetical protein FM106_22475 [Brachybacterium faecium]|nr:hypothetical protein FM106_22475 [Brachybacterium faecium]